MDTMNYNELYRNLTYLFLNAKTSDPQADSLVSAKMDYTPKSIDPSSLPFIIPTKMAMKFDQITIDTP